MKMPGFVLLILILLTNWSCNTDNLPENDEIVLTEKAAKLVDVNNQFGFELFQKIAASGVANENVMISPTSVVLALAMTYNGAQSATKIAMEQTLRLNGLTTEEINSSYQSLISGLKSLDTKVLLEIANAIYYRNNFMVESDFVTVNQKFYNAEITGLDFASPEALKIINAWVNTKTRQKIPSIIDEIKPNQVMFLLNAIYFKGIWSKQFNPKNTTGFPFILPDGKLANVEMMCRLDTLGYFSNNLFSAIKLPYGKENFNMYVLLPAEEKTVNEVILQLNNKNWTTWMSQFKETQSVDIRLPRFKFPYEIKLNDVLTDMGMGIAFTGAANFSGINRGGGLYIDYVKHKTFVEVNEEGTEAAAVTVVAIIKTMTGPDKISFHVNRPFIFAVTEKSTGAVLFLGTVKNPAVN